MARVTFEVGAGPHGPFLQVSGVALPGARYTRVPAGLLHQLGVTPTRTRQALAPDGTVKTYPAAWVTVRFEGRATDALVLLDDPTAQPVLGSMALEALGLMVDPESGTLVPMPVIEE